MIELIFRRGSEIIFIRIDGHNVTFSNSLYGATYAPIDNMKLDYDGVIKEHPDLKDKENWNEEAIRRFKDKIKSFETETEISDYVIKELKSVGYEPRFKQRQGHRKEAIV